MGFKLDCYELQEVMKIKYGKNQKKVEDENGEYPILGTGGVMGYANKFLYDKPSVLIGRKGSISKVKYIDKPFWTVDTLFYTEINKNKALPLYLYYYLSQIDFNYYNEGTTIPSLRTETLNKIEIYLPNIKVQNKIVEYLSNIDKKIELNNKIISNLEQVSQTLFKHWFIDFEFPNEEGKPYKSSGGEMVESELGEIPKGWKTYQLNDFAKSVSNSINKKQTLEAKFLNTSDILKGGVSNVPFSLTNEMPGQAKKLIEKNDILYSEIRPKNKRYAYVNLEKPEEYVVSTKLMVIRVNEDIFSSQILYLWLTMEETIRNLQQIAENRSGTFPQITFSILSKYKFAIPNREILKKLEYILTPFLDKQYELESQNQKLRDLRDTLLPILLSGEIEIPDDMEV